MNHVFVLNVTLSSFLNFASFHPCVQMLRVHPLLDNLGGQVVLRFLDRPLVHNLLLHLITLDLILLGVVLLGYIAEVGPWVFVLLSLNFFMLFIELIDYRVNFQSRRVDHGHHISWTFKHEVI